MQFPWDVRPKQSEGDSDFEGIFLQVGRALSAWEATESKAAELFDALVAAQPSNRAAFSAYISVVSASARTELLDAAFKCAMTKDDPAYSDTANVIEAMGKFGARRNEIAHGRLYNLGTFGFQLGPNNTMPKKWKDGAAKYQYCASDIEHYANCFENLCLEIDMLYRALVARNIAATKTRSARSRAKRADI